jgi:hypothetical protein
MSVPVNLTPMLSFFKQLGNHQRKKLIRKSRDVPAMKHTIDSFYVMYVLSTGIIDDVSNLLKFITENDWYRLPLQVFIISLSPSNIKEADQDTQ